MSTAEVIAGELIKRLFEKWDRRASAPVRLPSFEEALRNHLRDVANWSGRVEFFGFALGRDTDVATVDLMIALPRKFRGKRGAGQRLNEQELLLSSRHTVLLGDPGGGKTTTLKRLCRRLLTQAPLSDSDTSQFPLVIRLRELAPEKLLDEALADALAVPHERLEVDSSDLHKRGITLSEHLVFDSTLLGKRFVLASGNEPVLSRIIKLTEDTEAIILLDGLDEIPGPLRQLTERSIAKLAAQLVQTKIIVSCRSGDYNSTLTGFDALEICPLTQEQISFVATRWCSDAMGFMGRLESLPFADLASRPLFLCQLIMLYESSGFLPADPSAVYRRVVRLSLEEWDRQKRVDRPSKYAHFDPDRKLRFLSHLAFRLTFWLKAKQFDSKSLVEVYRKICGNFGLPKEDALEVVHELETHTGVFIEAARDRYEFCHLSLQEYLCAEFLVGFPMTDKLADYFGYDPAPLAVAVAVSAHPSRWLASLFLRRSVGRVLASVNLESFFARLEQEAPELAADKLLGFAALKILFSLIEPGRYTERFLQMPAVEESVASILPFYAARLATEYFDERYYKLTLSSYRTRGTETELPAFGRVGVARIKRIAQRAPVEFKELRE